MCFRLKNEFFLNIFAFEIKTYLIKFEINGTIKQTKLQPEIKNNFNNFPQTKPLKILS